MPSQSFNYSNSWQTWTVPAGVTSVDVLAEGGQGGNPEGTGLGGAHGFGGGGARVTGTLVVTPGQVLYIAVGAAGRSTGQTDSGKSGPDFSAGAGGVWTGGSDYKGGDGGGATRIRLNGSSGTELLVAGGGGGGGMAAFSGVSGNGGGGGFGGASGATGSGASGTSANATGGGGALSSTLAGSGGTQLGAAGNGVFGGGAASSPSQYWGLGGGGGGGARGGGGGGKDNTAGGAGGGGGGGSSHAANGSWSGVSFSSGFGSGDGVVTLTWASAPVADFLIPSGAPYEVGEVLSFVDSSTNTPTSWLWDFGDGTTSTLQNPTKAWTAPGTYTVTLTATNAAGFDDVSVQFVIVGGRTHQMMI